MRGIETTRCTEHDAELTLLAKVCRLLANVYGLTVACDKCGAPEMAPCISDSGRFTIHSTRATKAVASVGAES